ncbi:MAG: phosphopantetheine-binding protein [Endomicrobium sp.]|nr:phosphopantetheine-binding protein [Endomicrobium sp.]
MTRIEIIEALKDLFEVENLSEDIILSDFEGWDSIMMMSLVSFADINFKKQMKMQDMKNFKTIKDIINFLNI